MPFGAKVLEHGETRFALWAPAAETVDLILEDGVLLMHREEDGTFALTTQGVQGGLLQMVNHGISTGALFFLVGMLLD